MAPNGAHDENGNNRVDTGAHRTRTHEDTHMPHDATAPIWPTPGDHYYRDLRLQLRPQDGPTCVAATLAVLTDESPEIFDGAINTQDPVSWSDALRPYGMKLAYCPTDVRRLQFYAAELRAIDDLFLLCYYSPLDSSILDDPNDDGWVCGSHVVTLLRDRVYDTQTGRACDLADHGCLAHFTKRIFRVVPADHPRGL